MKKYNNDILNEIECVYGYYTTDVNKYLKDNNLIMIDIKNLKVFKGRDLFELLIFGKHKGCIKRYYNYGKDCLPEEKNCVLCKLDYLLDNNKIKIINKDDING